MKKIILAAAITFTALFSAFSIEVNENELKTTGGIDTIRFENYSGPHKIIESIAAIEAIGSGLGTQVAQDINKMQTIAPNAKYSVIHAVDPQEKGKLDADILVINKTATVDHIKNLRRIIAAYLRSAYGYSYDDSVTIATFVTVYNAVYRTNLDAFSAKYKKVVTDNLAAEKCGLSTKWTDWPGNSQIVIPLGDLAEDAVSTVDTSVISDKNVVSSMQEEDSKGIDERKNMVDIKEREAEKASEKAQTAAKEAAQESKKVEEQKQIQKEAEKKAETAKEEAAKDPENVEKQQAAEEAQQEAEEEAEKTEEMEEKVQEAQEQAQQQQQISDRKTAEAQEERKEIAKDQLEVIQQEIRESSTANNVIGLSMKSAEMSAMVKIDSTTGEVLRESPVTVIHGRTIIPVSGATIENTEVDNSTLYLAICGEDAGNGAVKLCLLDTNKMEIQKESKEDIASDSVLVKDGDSYYCIVREGSSNFVGKYDKSLNLLLKSPVNVRSETPVTVTSKGIVVTEAGGKTILLKLNDLTSVSNYNDTSDAK